MKKEPDYIKHHDALHTYLSAQYKALVASGSSEELLKAYSSLLRFLKSLRSGDALQDELALVTRSPEHTDEISELRGYSLGDLEKAVLNEETSRKTLERLAIDRFSVPKGSMRQYSSRALLTDKLLSLIRNERAHQTIGAVARSTDEFTS